jgi:16S rRNA processing protein RimM
MPGPWIHIGRVVSVNPARRELRIRPVPVHAGDFTEMGWVRVVLSDETEMRCRAESVRTTRTGVVVALTAGVTRDNVARMKGGSVVVGHERIKRRTDSGCHVSELHDMEVFDEEGNFLGAVKEAYPTGANDVIEVEQPSGKVIILPVIAELVETVDVDRGRITVRDITPYVVEDED